MSVFEKEFLDYQETRRSFWGKVRATRSKSFGGYYRKRLQTTYHHLVPEGAKVLEVGCDSGNLLAALKPSEGVGVDFCPEALDQARTVHPDLEFVQADAHQLDLGDRTFDYIVVSELVNDLWDVQTVLGQLHPYCATHTRIIFNFYSHTWNVPLRIAQAIGIATPNLSQNWLTKHDVANLL